MNRPPLLRPVFKGVPAELRAVPRWLLWRPEWVEKAGLPEGGKWNKIPVDAKTGGAGSSTNPDTWADFDTAREAYEKAPKRWGGVGFVLVADDSLMGGDCDRVIAEPPEGGSPVLSDAAAGYVAALRTYWEVSPSGRGLRFFAFAEKPEGACKRGELEMYDSGRFLTVTGRHWPAAPPAVLSCAPEVAALHALWFPAPPPRPQAPTAPLLNLPKAGANGSGHTSNGSGHVFGSVAAWSDDKLLSKIRASPAQGAKFERLWYGDNSDHAGDDSAGDAALAAILLWWTNYDAARAEQLFRQSARAQREKVAARADYLIPHAIESVMAKWDGRPGYDPGVEMDLGSGGKGKKPGFREFGEFNELTPVSENDPWEAPIPFTGAGGAALPPFPVDALPSWLGEYVSDVAVAIEVPPDLPAALSLSVLATSVQKKVEVEVKPGYREPLNLWTVTALESGGRKSSTVDEVSAPVVVYEAEENRRREGEIAAAESDRAILEDRLKDAQRRAVKEKLAVERGAAQDEARELARQLREAAVPQPCRLMTEDCTPERFASLMAENGGRMTILSAEGGETFDIIAGRYSDKGPNMGIYLKSHAGDDARIDRQGGKRSETIRRAASTFGLCPQPEVLRGLLKIPGALGRGLLARPLYSMPRSTVGYRTRATAPLPDRVRAAYQGMVGRLLGLRGAPAPQEGGDEAAHILHLTPEARALLAVYRQSVEFDLRDGGELAGIKAWGSKLPGQVARIAGLLHLAGHADEAEPWSEPITEGTMQDAVTIGDYYRVHSKAAFAEMGADKDTDDARALLSFVRRHADKSDGDGHDPTRFKSSEAYRSLHDRFNKSADMEPALSLLCARHYIRLAEPERKPGTPGRPPAPIFAINPAIHKAEVENREPLTKLTKLTKPPENAPQEAPEPEYEEDLV